jgi:DNA-binding MarR family transcriptional regulator
MEAIYPIYPGFLLRRLRQITNVVFKKECAHWGITPPQYGAMVLISRYGELDQRTLARYLGMDSATTGLIVKNLTVKRLVSRKSDPGDGRRWLLQLSARGISSLPAIDVAVERAYDKILKPLGSGRRTFVQAVNTLVNTHSSLVAAELVVEPSHRSRRYGRKIRLDASESA